MSIRNIFTENIVLPISDLLTRQSIYKKLKFLNKSQWWSREELDNYQNIKLKALIEHAYTNVPYYKELFDKLKLKPSDINSKNDLYKLPILTKETIRENIQNGKIIARNIPKNQMIYSSSSGSTGEPLIFYKTRYSESFNKASALRAWYWMGYRLGDKYVKISMNPRTSIIKKLQDFVNNCKYLASNQLIDIEFQKINKSIKKFNPKFIRCYPVPLLFLSEVAKQQKPEKKKSLVAINTTGSILHNNHRNTIEKVFETKIFDSYSCEGGAICAQCESLINYHFSEEFGISEFIEDTYSHSDSNHPVRHITTDLTNYATPFLRYDSQDYVVLGDKKQCKCGRAFQNIKQIIGRDSDILITPSGKYLIVENFVAYFEWIESVDQIQIIQNEIDCITINMIVNLKFTPAIYEEIYNYWKNYIGNDVNLIIKKVDKIQLTPTGKRRTVIRNPKIKLSV